MDTTYIASLADTLTIEQIEDLMDVFGLEESVVFDTVAGTLWERCAMIYEAAKGSDKVLMSDPEFPEQEFFLSGRQYTDDEIGKLDGPGRYVNWVDMAGIRPAFKAGRTAKGSMTKRQRKAARRADRKAKREAA
jgi:hypothetical protein